MVRKILIFGINSFIGQHLNEMIRSNPHYETHGTTNRTPLSEFQHKCDLRNSDEVATVVNKVAPHIVVHLAAVSTATHTDLLEYYNTNVIGTQNVINALQRVGQPTRLIYFSTAGVYGNQGLDSSVESSAPKPISHYGYSKFVAESIVQTFCNNINPTIFRPFNILGPQQKPDFLIPKLLRAFVDKADIIKLGNINTTRDYIDVDFTCNLIIDSIDNSDAFGEIINISSGNGVTLSQIFDMLSTISGHRPVIEVNQQLVRTNEIWSLVGDTEKRIRIFGDDLHLTPRPIYDILNGLYSGRSPQEGS